MYAQLLITASFVLAAYQDIRERAVNDLVWIPAAIGVAYAVFELYLALPSDSLEFLLVKVLLIGGIAFVFTYLGGIGEADAIAIAFVAADPYKVSPLPTLFATAFVALGHIGYEYAVGNAKGAKLIPMKQFLREQRWIPKAIVSDGSKTPVNSDVNVAREEVEASGKPDAMVEVSYGVPTVAYLGIGYVVYLVYMIVFNYAAFIALP